MIGGLTFCVTPKEVGLHPMGGLNAVKMSVNLSCVFSVDHILCK